ncbi:MAG: prepilin-type N-terminal cleavage/methylation domain-containing protein [Candidatus Omnitrophota bacterium]
MFPKGKNLYGFTLVEMAVVMVIIMLLATIAIPNLGRPSSAMKLNTAARNISTILRTARSYAVTKRAIHIAVFDTTVTPSLIYITDNAGLQVSKGYALSSTLSIANITFLLDVDNKNKASFKASGGLTDTSLAERGVWVRKSGEASYITSPPNFKRITVDSVTGRVTIDETPPS